MVGGLFLIPSRFGVTPRPAVKGHCGIRLDPRRSPARRRRGRPLCPRLASGRPLTAALGAGNALPAIDDAPGGAKSAPPVINHKEKKTMSNAITITGNLTREPELFSGRGVP
jgi:hypothetical protein